jgi:hypothetical protein
MSATFSTASARATRITWADMATIAIIAVVILVAGWLHTATMLQNHDADWLMVAARRLLQGGRYITDFNEVTPPLILPLMAPPAALAAVTGIAPYTAFVWYVCLLIAASVVLVRPALRWCMADRPWAANLVLIGYATIVSLEPGYEFGQREHFFLLMFFPGALWFVAREAGRDAPMDRLDWTALVLAAIGVLIKPYYLLIPLALLLIRFYRLRTWRVLLDKPVFVFAVAAVVYGVMIVLLFPEYFREAALQKPIYFGWDRAWLTVLDASRDTISALALAIVLTELLALPRQLRQFLRLICVISVCCLVVALAQKKGWPYHLMPALELAACALTVIGVSLLGRLRPPTTRTQSAVLLAVLGAQGIALCIRPWSEAQVFTRARFAERPLIHTLHDQFAGKSVLLLTSGLQFGFPSLAGVEMGSRHPGQPFLAGTVKLEAGGPRERAVAAPLRQIGIDMTAEDLARYKPDVVAVDVNVVKQGLPDNFDMLGFYLSGPGFRAAWADYKLDESIPGWDLYTRRAQ